MFKRLFKKGTRIRLNIIYGIFRKNVKLLKDVSGHDIIVHKAYISQNMHIVPILKHISTEVTDFMDYELSKKAVQGRYMISEYRFKFQSHLIEVNDDLNSYKSSVAFDGEYIFNEDETDLIVSCIAMRIKHLQKEKDIISNCIKHNKRSELEGIGL